MVLIKKKYNGDGNDDDIEITLTISKEQKEQYVINALSIFKGYEFIAFKPGDVLRVVTSETRCEKSWKFISVDCESHTDNETGKQVRHVNDTICFQQWCPKFAEWQSVSKHSLKYFCDNLDTIEVTDRC